MSRFIKALRSGIAASVMALPAAAVAEEASVVLVHGAFSNGSAWDEVIPILH
ncbi:MAG: hypothetical protein AAF667_09725 [Pseudomonadota bacterium]